MIILLLIDLNLNPKINDVQSISRIYYNFISSEPNIITIAQIVSTPCFNFSTLTRFQMLLCVIYEYETMF